MSESRYFNEQFRLFQRRFPRSAGWKVFEPRQYDLLGMPTLPEFLRARHPDAIRQDSTIPVLNRKVRGGFSLQQDEWSGDLTLVWEGAEIYCRIVQLVSGTIFHHSALFIATKSDKAFESLCKELWEYGIEKQRLDPSIKVISGFERSIPRPEASWDDLILPGQMLDDIRKTVQAFFSPNAKETYLRYGLAYRRGILFTGPAGSGKTMCSKVIAATMKDVSCLAYTARGGSREADILETAFEKAAALAPAILILEDLERFGRYLPLAFMLNLMDGLETHEGILVIGTSNAPELLDPALLLRPSRFDRIWKFGLPEYEERLAFLKKRGQQFNVGVLEIIARGTGGFTVAYLQEVFATAVGYAVSESREVVDSDLLRSFEILRGQIKTAQAAQPAIGGPAESMGFRINGNSVSRD